MSSCRVTSSTVARSGNGIRNVERCLVTGVASPPQRVSGGGGRLNGQEDVGAVVSADDRRSLEWYGEDDLDRPGLGELYRFLVAPQPYLDHLLAHGHGAIFLGIVVDSLQNYVRALFHLPDVFSTADIGQLDRPKVAHYLDFFHHGRYFVDES